MARPLVVEWKDGVVFDEALLAAEPEPLPPPLRAEPDPQVVEYWNHHSECDHFRCRALIVDSTGGWTHRGFKQPYTRDMGQITCSSECFTRYILTYNFQACIDNGLSREEAEAHVEAMYHEAHGKYLTGTADGTSWVLGKYDSDDEDSE